MIQTTLAAWSAAVSDVRLYIEIAERRVEAVKEILALTPSLEGVLANWAQEVSKFQGGRRFDYVSAVISLYGAYERFVEDVAEAYLTSLADAAPKYTYLPEKLRAAHFSQVLSHLQRTRDTRYDGRASAQELAVAFANCLSDSSPFEFLVESLLHHTANFRTNVVDDYFGRIGVESASRRAVKSRAFASYMDGVGKAVSDDRPEAALDLVGDLVSRRNEVAHGSSDNILGPNELGAYCDQVDAYCQGIAAVLEETLLEYLFGLYGVDHGKPVEVYNHNIVCVRSKGRVLAIGDVLVFKRTDESLYSSRIAGIELNGCPIEEAPEGRDVIVALKIDGRCKTSYSVHSGVYERVSLSESNLVPGIAEDGVLARAEDKLVVLRERRNEAYFWLIENGDGPNAAWLQSEYERCCRDLENAERLS